MSSRKVLLKKKWIPAIASAERSMTHLIELQALYAPSHPEIGRQLQALIEMQETLVQVMGQLKATI